MSSYKAFSNSGPLSRSEDEDLLVWFNKNLPKKRDSMLDFGCGYGTWTSQIANLGGFQAVKIIEPDNKAFEFTTSLLGDLSDQNNDTFDLVVSFAVLELFDIETQLSYLQDFKSQLTSPNGRIFLLYNFYHPFSIRWILLTILGLGNAKKFHLNNRFQRSFLKFSGFKKVCDEAGLNISDWYSPNLFRGYGPSSRKIKIPNIFSTVFVVLEPN